MEMVTLFPGIEVPASCDQAVVGPAIADALTALDTIDGIFLSLGEQVALFDASCKVACEVAYPDGSDTPNRVKANRDALIGSIRKAKAVANLAKAGINDPTDEQIAKEAKAVKRQVQNGRAEGTPKKSTNPVASLADRSAKIHDEEGTFARLCSVIDAMQDTKHPQYDEAHRDACFDLMLAYTTRGSAAKLRATRNAIAKRLSA